MVEDLRSPEVLFQQHGMLFTGTRAHVFSVLRDAGRPLSTKAVWEALNEPKPDLTTVYRCLTAMTQLGVARKIAHGRNVFLYELTTDGGHSHRVVCQACGRTEDLPCRLLTELSRQVQDSVGYHVDHQSLEIPGLCPGCTRNKP